MVVEDIYVVQSHPAQALVQAGHQILLAAPVAVRPRPHVVSGFGGDDQLVPVGPKALFQDAAEILLRRAVHRAVIVGQVEMGDAIVERSLAHVQHVVEIAVGAEIVPQPQRHRRELQPAGPAAVILHFFIP